LRLAPPITASSLDPGGGSAWQRTLAFVQGFLNPVGDPLQSPVYLAEGDIIGMSPQHDLPDLAAVAKYVDDIASAHDINLMGCYRGWYFQDGPPIVYDPSETGADMNGIAYPRADGSTVRLYNPPGRAGHFYKDPPEGPVVVFAAPSTGPISHKLLVLHELAHALTATTEADHGRGWISAWLVLVDEHLPDVAAGLRGALAVRLVTHGTG
jgi:hypothetical protein